MQYVCQKPEHVDDVVENGKCEILDILMNMNDQV